MACPSSMASERKPPELTPSTTFDNISALSLHGRCHSLSHLLVEGDLGRVDREGTEGFRNGTAVFAGEPAGARPVVNPREL